VKPATTILIPPRRRLTLAALMCLLASGGCDDTALHVAREAADRQARQNHQMAQLHREVAAGAKRLVEEDAQARHDVLAAHRDLQAERSQLAAGWEALETERRSIAGARRTESMLAALVSGGGAAVAALIALALAWLTLFGLRRRDDSAEMACELLIEELAADVPKFSRLAVPFAPRMTLVSHEGDEPGASMFPSTEENP